MAFYFPLIDFDMACEDYRIADNLVIKRDPYDLEKVKVLTTLSEHDRLSLKRTNFWVVVTGSDITSSEATILINILLLSFWIVGSLRATTFFKFFNYKEVSVYHDCFQKNEKDMFLIVTEDLLEKATSFYKALVQIHTRKKRLQTAMVNTFYGCVTIQGVLQGPLFSL